MSFVAALMLLAIYSCSETGIGSSLTATRTEVVRDSSFSITGYSTENNTLPARTLTQLLGVIQADNYGTMTSDFVSQMMPAWPIDTAYTTANEIDSCCFIFRLPIGGYTGDSITPMRATVYRLNKPLPRTIDSSFDPTGYYDETGILGAASFSATALSCSDSLSNVQNTNGYREFSVKVDRNVAVEIYNKFKENPDLFRDPATFESIFPGIYVTTTFGSGRITNISNTQFRVYYRQNYTTEDTDTTFNVYASYMASTEEVLSNNNIRLEISDAVKEMVANGEAIVQTPAAYDVTITLPVQEILDRYRNDNEAQTVFNSVRLEIPAEELANDRGIAPPEYLLLIPASKKNEFLSGNNAPDNETSFYAQYDGTKDCYTFTEMRQYFINLLDDKDGVAEEEDCIFSLTPIDVLTDDNEGSSTYNYTSILAYYYYGYYPTSSSSSTIVEVKPAMERPSIIKLDLENAKLKLYYSRLFQN